MIAKIHERLSARKSVRRSAITLLECVVVIAIVGVLLSVLIPSVQFARESARCYQCQSQLKQIALALHQYHDARSAFPPGKSTNRPGNSSQHAYWMAFILPYIEQQGLYEEMEKHYSKQENPFFPVAHLPAIKPVYAYACPSDDRVPGPRATRRDRQVALTSYVGCVGSNHTQIDGVLFADSRVTFAAITDGTSNTTIVGERPPSPDFWYGWWYAGMGDEGDGVPDGLLGANETNEITGSFMFCGFGPHFYRPGRVDRMCDTLHFWSRHPSGAGFAFADGSVRFISYDSEESISKCATRAGEEIANP